MLKRFRPPYIRDLLQRFRADSIKAAEAAAELAVSPRRFYKLYQSYLQAVARRQAHSWSPGLSGGNHRKPWPKAVCDLIFKLLKSKPPCSYSLIASELQRRLQFKTDRATVRRYALKPNLAPASPPQKPKPKRRWQTQKVGQLWQYDASPHRWFAGQDWQPVLLHLLDDHSRVILGARLYERESLLAHLDFLSRVFQASGLPLCLYVDYHSFFFTHTPEAHTQLAAALAFYDVSLRFAPTPQAKGKIERGHQFWQKRLPALFRAEGIADLTAANPFIEELRKHHNQMEIHREIDSTPQAAWDRARKQDRCALRPAPKCPWWPFVFSQRNRLSVGSDCKVNIGSQRLGVDVPPATKVIRCLHPNGDVTVLQEVPAKNKLPVILLSTRLC